MLTRPLNGLALVSCVVGVLLIANTNAIAGGFALREMSSYGQGASYAGVAGGGDLSTMFWNPATMTQVPGIQIEGVAAGVLPYTVNSPGAGSTLLFFGGSGDSGNDALVPSGYFSYQINPKLWLGVAINAPYGLSVSFPDMWAGRDYAANDTSLNTYNTMPSIAYRINDWISVGLGMQIEYGDATLRMGLPYFGGGFSDFEISGNGWGYGVSAGVTLTPTPTTIIGIGYRSALNQKISGSMAVTGPLAALSTNGSVHTTLDLPDVVSLGVRQKLDPKWTLLGTVEWTNWSRIGASAVYQSSGASATVAAIPVTLPFQYKDGWLFSAGAEYQWTDQLAVRGGIGYEISPITDQVRIPLIPDNDRFWLSGGLTYKLTPKLTFDIAYSHLFVKSAPIDVSLTSGSPWFDGVTYIGNASSHVDIVSVALKYRWDNGMTASESTSSTH